MTSQLLSVEIYYYNWAGGRDGAVWRDMAWCLPVASQAGVKHTENY